MVPSSSSLSQLTRQFFQQSQPLVLIWQKYIPIFFPIPKAKIKMKLSSFVTALAGVEAVFAARFTQQRWERHEKRAALRGKGHPKLPGTDENGEELHGKAAVNETYQTTYSQNWAGAVLIGTGYTSVIGTFVVPSPKTPTGGSTSTAVSNPLRQGSFLCSCKPLCARPC